MQPIYYVKPVDNSRLAPRVGVEEPRQYLLGALLGAVLLMAGLFFALGRYRSLEYGYRIERLEREKTVALETNRKLQLEEASLGDPLRIDWIARNELGMKTLAPSQIFRAEPPPTLAAVDPNHPAVMTARVQTAQGIR